MEEQEEKGKRAAPGALYVQGSSQSMGARDWEGLRALVPAGACLMMIGKWAGLGCGALGVDTQGSVTSSMPCTSKCLQIFRSTGMGSSQFCILVCHAPFCLKGLELGGTKE